VSQHGFTGAYNGAKRFVAKVRRREPEQFGRLSFLPAEKMQVDYGEGALTRVPGADRYRKPKLFVATLRYSRRCFRRVVWRSSQDTWAQLHEQAWRYFGGSCRYGGAGQPQGRRAQARPVQARAEPRVRGHAGALRRSGRRQVQAMYEEERPHLRPLPFTGMQYFTEAQRTVCDDGCVRVDDSSYVGSAGRHRLARTRAGLRALHQDCELRTQALLRTHARAQRPGTAVLSEDDRVFNPVARDAPHPRPGAHHRRGRAPPVRAAVRRGGLRGPGRAPPAPLVGQPGPAPVEPVLHRGGEGLQEGLLAR
jgi:hypothetical protein